MRVPGEPQYGCRRRSALGLTLWSRYVLPNHYLFSLAERTPADMAALLAVFHPVPPVIKRRARELLDAIRDTVKKVLAPAVAAAVLEPTSALATTDESMAVDSPTTQGAPPADNAKTVTPSLWSKGS